MVSRCETLSKQHQWDWSRRLYPQINCQLLFEALNVPLKLRVGWKIYYIYICLLLRCQRSLYLEDPSNSTNPMIFMSWLGNPVEILMIGWKREFDVKLFEVNPRWLSVRCVPASAHYDLIRMVWWQEGRKEYKYKVETQMGLSVDRLVIVADLNLFWRGSVIWSMTCIQLSKGIRPSLIR